MPLTFQEFEYQGDLPEALTEGEVASVRIIEDDVVADVPLFIRRHLIDKEHEIQQFLSSQSARELYVSGPPGCGKTVFMTLVAHRYAKKENKHVLMVNYRDTSCCHVFVLDGSRARIVQLVVNRTDIVSVVKHLLQEDTTNFDLCVFDGVRVNITQCSDLVSVLNSQTGAEGKIKKVIHTTSLEFHFPTGDKQQGVRSRISRVAFDSFTEDDHTAALTNTEFLKRLLTHRSEIHADILPWQQERERSLGLENDAGSDETQDAEMDETEEGVVGINSEAGNPSPPPNAGAEPLELSTPAIIDYANHKFFYAGGSARFMFEYTTEGLKTQLQKLVARLKQSEWEEFTTTSVAPSASNVVNSLMQQFSGNAIAVSKFILFEAYNRVEARLIAAVETVANTTGNPSLQGWAFELKQLEIIKSVLKGNEADIGRKVVESKEGLVFQPISSCEAHYDGTTLIQKGTQSLETGTVIWCLKWNQGCFDVAFFKAGTLLTLQFTVSADHSIKLQFIKDLKEAVESHLSESVGECIHVGVVGDPNNTANFTFKNPEGCGRSSWTLDFTVTASKSSALFASPEKAEKAENYSATTLQTYQVFAKKRQSSD